jgi:PAS domain S-box-containing protein
VTPIRIQLIALVVGVLTPLLALLAWNIRDDDRARRDEAGRELARMAELVAADADSFLLGTLRLVERVEAGSRGQEGCHPLFEQFALIDRRYSSLVGTDAQGRVLCSSLSAAEARAIANLPALWLPDNDSPARYSLSPPVLGRVTGRLITVMAVPATVEGPVRYYAVGIDLEAFRSSFASAQFPSGFVMTLISAEGHVLARFPDGDRLVGTRVPDHPFVRAVLESGSGGVTAARSFAGDDVLIGVAPVPAAGWTAAVSLPASVAFAESATRTQRALLAAGLVALVALVIARLVGVVIARPITRLREAVADVGAGRAAHVPVEGPTEIARVAAAFNGVLDARAAAERELREVAATSPVGIVRADLAGCRNLANRRWREIFGAAEGADLDAAWAAAIHPDDRDTVVRGWQEAVAARAPFRAEYRVGTADDPQRFVLSVWEPHMAEGGPTGFVGSVTDITELKQVEFALRESEQRFSLAVRASNAGIWDYDALAHTFYFSPRLRELLGFGDDPAAFDEEASFPEWIHPDDREAVLAAMRSHVVQDTRFVVDLRIRRRDGSYGWFLGRAQAIVDADGRLVRLAGSVSPIDREKAAESALLEANAALEQRVAQRTAELQQAIRDLESFSYSVAHDLRAPLRAISGFASGLAQSLQGRLSAVEQRQVGHILDRADRMASMIDDLLELSRVGRRDVSIGTVDMEQLFDAAIAEAAAEAAHAPQVTRGPLPAARADPALLRHAITNLVDNAFKFSSGSAHPRIEISAEPREGGHVYTVRDNGAGFDMSYADKLFGVFQRLHGEREFPGTGIGLAIVHAVLKRLGGRVWAEGKPGEGAAFHFWLPGIAEGDSAAAHLKDSPSLPISVS